MQLDDIAQLKEDVYQLEKDLGHFEGELDNDHMDEAAIILQIEVNGQPDVGGMTDVMSVRFTYVDTQENARGRNLKQIKFCLPKDVAEEFAARLYRDATTGRAVFRRRPCSSNRRIK